MVRLSLRLRRAVARSVATVPFFIGAIGLAPAAAEGTAGAAADPYQACLSSGAAAEGVMPAIEDCVRGEIHRTNQKLNRLYAELIRRLPASQMRALRESERAWIQRRDRTCLRENGGGAQDENVAFLQCLANETIDRTEWLRRRYKGAFR
ncbi:MAG: hypothetical protein JWO81_1398 [Alphaproteobacteria bacterium]|nr:hypothetical protein [Alphaproteobacteria bacterium]